MTDTNYTTKRKEHRAIMADRLEALVALYGYTSEREDRRDRCIRVEITTDRGLKASVEFDGVHQPDIFVVPWHMHFEWDTKLSDKFGEVNQFHRRKSTQVYYGFTDLMGTMNRRLEMIKDGSAFLVEVPA